MTSYAVPPSATPATILPGSTSYNFNTPSFLNASGANQQTQGGGFINPLSLIPKGNFLNGLDKFGGGLGFATPTTTGGITGTAGVTVPGAAATPGTLGSATLGSVMTGAGIGGLIGAVNPLARGSTVGSVGGMAGGAIGMAIGGPIGSAIGGFLGSSVGGLFGKKKPGVHLSEFQTGVWEGNDFNGGTGFTNKRADQSQAQAVHSDFTKYLNYLNQQYGFDFSGTAFRGGYNDLHQGGWFLGVKNNNKGGDPDVDPNAWTHFSFDPNSNDKFGTYASVAAGMLAAKGQLTQDAIDKIMGDVEKKKNAALLGGAGSGSVPEVALPNQSNKESFTDFLNRYRNGNLDSGPVTAQRTVEPKPDMNNPLVKTMIQPTERVAMSGTSLVPQGVTPVQGPKLTPGTEAYDKLPDFVKVSM